MGVSKENEKIMTAYLINRSSRLHSDGYAVLSFPTNAEKVTRALHEIDIDGKAHGLYAVVNVSSIIPGLADLLPEKASLNELNYLSAQIAAMGSFDRDTFSAAIEARRYCGSLTEIINLTQNLDSLECFPAFDLAQYGSQLLEVMIDEYADMVDKLADSDKPYEKSFASYVETLEQNFDATKYANKLAEAEQGSFTSYGYVVENSEFKEVYQGPRDIPLAYVVLPEEMEMCP
jgi:hypothetical protein